MGRDSSPPEWPYVEVAMAAAGAAWDDEGEDEHLLSLVAAAEASALASKRQKILSFDSPAGAASGTGGGGGGTAVDEGSYTAALRGSRSALWQQQQKQRQRQQGKGEGFRPVSSGRQGPLAADSHGFVTGVSTQDVGSSAVGTCFNCGQSGHWARDCRGMRGGGDGEGGYEADVPVKPCPCGLGDCLVLTSNTPRNPRRKFYRCPVKEENGGCSFFEWCDSPASGIATSRSCSNYPSVPELPCPCGAGSCLVLTAKTGKNVGQQFYRCPVDQGGGSCGFFKWCNQYNSLTNPLETELRCSTPTNKSYQSSGGRSVSACFKCGQGGHWARDCLKNELSSQVSVRGNSSSSSGSCFKCGQVGHWAIDCPAQDTTFTAGRRKV